MCGPEVEDTENTAEEMLCISKGKINSLKKWTARWFCLFLIEAETGALRTI